MSSTLSPDQISIIKSLTARMVLRSGGEKGAAHSCGISISTISNACNPHKEYTLSVKHLVILANLTQDFALINYIAELTGQNHPPQKPADIQALITRHKSRLTYRRSSPVWR